MWLLWKKAPVEGMRLTSIEARSVFGRFGIKKSQIRLCRKVQRLSVFRMLGTNESVTFVLDPVVDAKESSSNRMNE